MNYTTILFLGILLGVWALVWEVSTGFRSLKVRLDRLAEHLDSRST